jgi:hypothetical protein
MDAAAMISDVQNIFDFRSLLSWLSLELGWETGIDDIEDIDDITYEFEPEDIHLKPEAFAKIGFLRQLRPLHENQPWGIFAVEFENKRLDAASLRKILSGLVPKRRNRDHAVWDKKNLLFLCFWGENPGRTFGVVYFADKPRALPVIKTFYCTPKTEDDIQLQKFEDKLRKLSWPSLPGKPAPSDYEAWREQWTSPFTHEYRQVIRDSEALTSALAGIALGIRQKILDIFIVETENGPIHELYEKFKKALIHDMTETQFADMYAQTVVYGLFSARCMGDTDGSEKLFEPREAIDAIPSTNPFLQNLLKESFSRKNKLSFDELDLGDITQLLRNTDTKLILEDFNRQTGGGREDPVIYFYEGFLNAYEKEQKKRRGVYYTPQPVVKFMVQAVDDILKAEFGIQDGLASTETKTITMPVKKGKIIKEETREVPAIQILDPAAGTGTFLRQIILQIWNNFRAGHSGRPKAQISRLWNVYVREHLLSRLNGFELMMAPYAVAHMKLALVLQDTGYAFDEDAGRPSRVNVFLTNSLEEADREEGQVMLFGYDALAQEAEAARSTKKNRGINVVIGNPPYSGESANKGNWIFSLLDDYKKEPGGVERLKERNPKWINDDYVKFIRYAQLYVERSGSGIAAYINNHSFLDNPTFRGMRWNLLKSFDKIYIIDLHGNAKKKETAPDGNKDENVFDIQQGVSINIFVKKGQKNDNSLAKIYHCDLYGTREQKYAELVKKNLKNISFNKIECSGPNYFFLPKNFDDQKQYDTGFSVLDIFQLNGVGICSKRDKIAFQDTSKELLHILTDFRDMSEHELKLIYDIKRESRDQKIIFAKQDILKHGLQRNLLKMVEYRPFDIKWTYYTNQVRGFLAYPVYHVMKHFLYGQNVGLVLGRQGQVVGSMPWNLVFISSNMVDLNLFYRGGGSVFPLYLYDSKKHRRPNVNPQIITELEKKLNLSFVPEKNDSLALTGNGFRDGSFSSGQLLENTFCPLDLFDYIYAVLHSPEYREAYREFLKIDFPRIPYPKSQKHFRRLVSLGGHLRQLHLLEGPLFEEIDTYEPSITSIGIEKIEYKPPWVYINGIGMGLFPPIHDTIWNFYIGGYQPAQKWLKDRKGQKLNLSGIRHYVKIITALGETARIMGEIDKAGVL